MPKNKTAQSPNRRRKTGWRSVPLEIICNRAVLTLMKRFDKRRTLTYSDACELASQLCRSIARKYSWATDRDEYDLLNTCLREKTGEMFELA